MFIIPKNYKAPPPKKKKMQQKYCHRDNKHIGSLDFLCISIIYAKYIYIFFKTISVLVEIFRLILNPITDGQLNYVL